ncbi:hypothetical protein BDW74DRAFT_153464 [Aspergillus multicolor]|uniref:uncharacterized protein n=1 Tax=Aspergillus multicolor TaxID=41759 RepID=UPI003CCDECB1
MIVGIPRLTLYPHRSRTFRRLILHRCRTFKREGFAIIRPSLRLVSWSQAIGKLVV